MHKSEVNVLSEVRTNGSTEKQEKRLMISASLRGQLRRLAIGSAVLVVCFALPLYSWARFALHSELYSYVLLIPFISFYLSWLKRDELAKAEPAPDRKLALVPAGLGAIAMAGYFLARPGLKLPVDDALAWFMVSFLLLFVGVFLFCMGKGVARALAFPLAFLIFMAPFPGFMENAIEKFLQYQSANAAELLFGLVGMPLLRDGVVFRLPGFSLQVAPECSGIHSTLVLFICSLAAGQIFLRSNGKRALFAAVVLPLGIARNAFRIVVIGELCVQVDPAFIDSPLHHRGGPIFFALSMIPFLLLLWWMRRREALKR